MAEQPATMQVQVAPGVYLTVAGDVVADASEPRPNDLGRYEITEDPDDRWRYKTPSLRNVALTAPYMHDGSLKDFVGRRRVLQSRRYRQRTIGSANQTTCTHLNGDGRHSQLP